MTGNWIKGTLYGLSPNSISPKWNIFTLQFKFLWKTYSSASLCYKNQSIQVSPSQNNTIPKQHKKRIIWTQNGQKQGNQIFFRAWCLNKNCRGCSSLLKYEISAKTNEVFLRKWQKTVKNPHFGHKKLNNLDTHFCFKIGLRHFSTLITG